MDEQVAARDDIERLDDRGRSGGGVRPRVRAVAARPESAKSMPLKPTLRMATAASVPRPVALRSRRLCRRCRRLWGTYFG